MISIMKNNSNIKKVLGTILIFSLLFTVLPTAEIKAETSGYSEVVNTDSNIDSNTNSNTESYVAGDASSTPESVTNLKEYDTNEVIVQYKSSEASADQSALKEEDVTPLTDDTSLVELDSRTELKNTIQDLKNDPDVAYIQPNYKYEIWGLSNDTYSDRQWAYSNDGSKTIWSKQEKSGIDINLSKAWGLFPTTSDKQVIVAVVDTGVDYDHKDLADHMWTNSKEIPGNGVDDDKNGYVDDVHGWNFYDDNNVMYDDELLYNPDDKGYEAIDDHGTHVAGIIAATADNGVGVAGVASKINVKIMPVKALGELDGESKDYGTTSSITQAIQYADSMGATICNLSVGGTSYDPIMREAMADSKMLFVVAAGNGDPKTEIGYNTDDTPMYPACYDLDNIISVANIMCDGNLNESSNYGPQSIDIAAPGTDIVSTVVDVNNSSNSRKVAYSYYTGTSMAAPMVSGVAALISAYKPTVTNRQIKNSILNTTQKLDSLSGKLVSGGMLEAYAALNYDTTSPVIQVTQQPVAKSNNKKLIINVTRPNSQITTVHYAKGVQNIDYFEGGIYGTALEFNGTEASLTVSKSGSYTIYALDNLGNEAVYTEKVDVLKVTKVSLATTQKTLKKGQTFQLKAAVNPAGVYTKLTYKSSNTKIITINSKGKVTAKGRGIATITVLSDNGKKTTCRITVK